MKHFILYYHGGSSNHGCEAIVRTTSELLDYKNNKITLASFRPETDVFYGLNTYCDVHNMLEKKAVSRFNPLLWKAYAELRINNNYHPIDDLPSLLSYKAKKGDIAISIGGDNYCYNDNRRIAEANRFWRRNKVKTVLWGCSVEPELLLDSKIAEDISEFDLVTARESISYEALRKINTNTVLVSDTAFLLNTIEKPMPDGFKKADIVGFNLSPLVLSCEKTNGIAMRNIENLIEYIFENTNMKVLLIPHVVWNHDNDQVVNDQLFQKYYQPNRIAKVNDCNCEEIKGYISRCRFFIGARTHASIAAYSSFIPTLVLGYSVKSRGIARDLFGEEENYVIPVQKLQTEWDMVNAFIWLVSHEDRIKKCLRLKMDNYKKRVYAGLNALLKL